MGREIAAEAFLANLPFFKGLEPPVLAHLASGTTRRALRKGACLFREGDMPTGLYAVVYGRVKLALHDGAGREVRADLIAPGHTFGEAMLFLDRPYMVQASALSDALVLHVARDTIFEALRLTPAFARRVIGALAERVEWLVRERNELAIGSTAQRLVAWLLRRRELTAPGGAAIVQLPASKRVLAARLNASPEHLSRVLRELAANDLIVVRGRTLAVPDVERLRAWQLAGAVPAAACAAAPAAAAHRPARRKTLAAAKEPGARYVPGLRPASMIGGAGDKRRAMNTPTKKGH